MQVGLRSVRGMRWPVWVGLLVTLAAAVCDLATPAKPQAAHTARANEEGAPPSPRPPFVPPLPTPLPPEQAAPFVPTLPLPSAEPIDPPAPVVRLHVRAPARVEPDKEIEYRLTVENVSGADAHHVLVRDRLPRGVDEYIRAEPKCQQTKTKNGLTDLLWDLGTLKAGEQKRIVLALKPKGTEDIHNRAYVQFEHGQKVTTRIAKAGETPALHSATVPPDKPRVRVKITAPAQAILYREILFHIEVANPGSVPLRNVVVSSELPEGLEFVGGKPEPGGEEKPLTWKLGDLPPHQTRRLECRVISKQAGKFRTKAKATAEGGTNAADRADVTVGEAKLKIRVSGPQRRLANRPIPYHITVCNLGTLPATNVQVSDELPRDIKFDRASASGRKEGGFVRWSLGTLPPGERRSLLLVLRAPQPGWCWNEAAVRADRNLVDKARSEPTRIESANTPVIEIDKNTDWLVVGQKATYKIRLFHPGKNNVLHPHVVVRVPGEIVLRGQRGPTPGQQDGQLVRFAPLGTLDGGQEETYTVEVEAKKAGEAALRAWWTDGRSQAGPVETWEEKILILDPAQRARHIASQAQNLRARFLIGALQLYVLRTLMKLRSPCWTWADAPVPIP